jgi:DNA sulfur modification protein DndB
MGNLYSALELKMGDWQYYSIVMRMHELANEVNFGSEVHHESTLDDAIQRNLKSPRIRNQISQFLTRREDRFFSSLVVTSKGGQPTFSAINIDSNDPLKMLENSVANRYGILQFDGSQSWYALDGQHRLAAIKAIVAPDASQISVDIPDDFDVEAFKNETISVLVVTQDETLTEEDWLKRYRRLFSSLNRYAKSTSLEENIIMDEDDVFAITTRRLISDHDFFKSTGRTQNSFKVNTVSSSLREGSNYFIPLKTLYQINKVLLSNKSSANAWPLDNGQTTHKVSEFIGFRPAEDTIDEMYERLHAHWDALLEVLPQLTDNPALRKTHNPTAAEASQHEDSVLFWPIGQLVLGDLARALLDRPSQLGGLANPLSANSSEISTALQPLAKLDWNLQAVPARGLLLWWDDDSNKDKPWKMRSDQRPKCINLTTKLYKWQLGLTELTDQEVTDLKFEWLGLVLPYWHLDPETGVHSGDDKNELWSQILDRVD